MGKCSRKNQLQNSGEIFQEVRNEQIPSWLPSYARAISQVGIRAIKVVCVVNHVLAEEFCHQCRPSDVVVPIDMVTDVFVHGTDHYFGVGFALANQNEICQSYDDNLLRLP